MVRQTVSTAAHRCDVTTTTDKFTIHPTADATRDVKVGCHVFG